MSNTSKATQATKTKAASAGKPAGPGIAVQDVTHLLVRSRKAGFRRAGRAWSTEETRVAIDELTPEQISELLSDPMLIVLPLADTAADGETK